jgi:hypothetical protein
MNKRTAIALAAGVVVALLVGIMSVSLSSTPTAVADPGHRTTPRVRTVHRTVTVHRTASPTPGATRTVVVSSPGTTQASTPAMTEDEGDDHGDDGFENESGDDGSNAGSGSESSGHGSGDD